MENNVKIILLFITIIGCDTLKTVPKKSTQNVQYDGESYSILHTQQVLSEIEENQAIGSDCSTYSDFLISFINQYKEIRVSLPMACHIHLKRTSKTLQSTIDEWVKYKQNDYMQNIEKMKLQIIEINKIANDGECFDDAINDNQNLLNNTIVSLIQNGQSAVAYNLYKNFKGFTLPTLIRIVYDNKVSNADKLIDFINLFSDDEEIINGYRLLFDHMASKEHIYSTPIATIAYCVFVNYKQKFMTNKNLIYLREKLPESLNNFKWNQLIVQRNVKLNELSYYHDVGNYRHSDNLRVLTFTHLDRGSVQIYQAFKFIPEQNGKYFYIKSNTFDQYIYADSDEYDFNSEQRAVYGWRKANVVKETGRWQLEPILGSPYFKIKNIHWNEYLAIAEGANKVPGRADLHQLLTLKSGRCDDDFCKWNILRYTGA